jgi:hypothetical protein
VEIKKENSHVKRKSIAIVTSILLIFFTLACQLVTGKVAPSVPATATAAEIPVIVENTKPAPTDNSIAETRAAAEESVQATMESAQATVDAVNQAIEETSAVLEETANAAAAEEAQTQTQAASGNTLATAQAQEFVSVIDDLTQKGFLENSAGKYSTVEDFNENWAQIGWYQWWNTGFEPANFVIRAHTEWESASKTANWYDSGCGFVFREEDEDNHYMIFLALDGYVYLKAYVDGEYKEFGKGNAVKIDHNKGGADVMLVVEGSRILYFVNGEKVLDRKNEALSEGKLALTLVSGTNKDYGTRCNITNIELWELSQ